MTIKERMEKQLAAAKEEEKALRAAVTDGETKEERMTAQEALDKVTEKIKEINDIIAELDEPADTEAPAEEGERKINKISETRGAKQLDNIEERAKQFAESGKMKMEARSTLVSGGGVATPTGVSGINDPLNGVSSIVDLVKVENCVGMGANKIAYMTEDSTASTQTEGNAPAGSDPTFAFVTIQPTSKIVVSYISKQVTKQSPLNYKGKVEESATRALKKEVGALITTAIKGSSLNTVIEADLDSSNNGKIDEKTLRKIVLGYGGSEGVEGSAWLFLNKTDLVAFGDVRGTSEKKAVYEITPDTNNPNIGIIKDGGLSVKYCINSNLTACNGTAQAASSGADKVTMLYGNPQNCELDVFSDYEIAVSEDYKFAENMLAVRGDCEMGAAVIRQGGFVAYTIKKATV